MSKLQPSKKTSGVSYHIIDDKHEGQRIDNFLQAILKKCPKQRIYRMLRKGEVRVNSGRINATYRLKIADKVRVPPVWIAGLASDACQLSAKQKEFLQSIIVFEDNGLLVINKPSGLAVHSGSGVRQGLIEQLRLLKPAYKNADLVHRLDRHTSGCVLVAKRRSLLRHLHAALADGEVFKRYHVLVHGCWKHPGQYRCVTNLLTENRKQGERLVVISDDVNEGKPSITRFEVIQHFGKTATLLAAYPETGRTHQIRVHCQHLGHPVVGDDRYGNKTADKTLYKYGCKRLFLHAERIDFADKSENGTGKRRIFHCEPDKEWSKCLSQLAAIG